MGVEKLTPAEFINVFGIVFITLGTSLGAMTMDSVFSKKSVGPVGANKKTWFLIEAPMALMSAVWLVCKGLFAGAFAKFINKYAAPSTSNEEIADFYLIATLYASFLASIWVLPHICHIASYGWRVFCLVLSAMVNLALAIAITAIYFQIGHMGSGGMCIPWILLLLVVYFWFFWDLYKNRKSDSVAIAPIS